MYNLIETNLNEISYINKEITVFKHKDFFDNRGSLSVQFEGLVPNKRHISLKESISKKFTARGLHHQKKPYGQVKIIYVEKGEILDVFLDTEDKEKKVYCLKIDDSMKKSILIPERYAHGFITLKKTKFKYLCLGKYSEKHEVTYNLLDNIAKKMKLKNITMSNKDSSFPKIKLISNIR